MPSVRVEATVGPGMMPGVCSHTWASATAGLAPIRSEPAFRELLRELAGRWIELAERRGARTQAELRMLALAHLQRDELDQALAALESALAAGGPLEPVVRAELEALRVRQIRQGAAADGRGKEGGHRAQAP